MIARIVVVALAAAVVACGGGDPEPVAEAPAVDVATAAPAVDCLDVSDAVRDSIAADLTLEGATTIEAAAAVAVQPPTASSGETWHAIALRVTADGVGSVSPVWITTSDPAGEGIGGAVFAANSDAEAFGPYPFPDAVRDWTHADGKAQIEAAEACVAGE